MADEDDWRLIPGDDEWYSGLVLIRRKFRAKYSSDHAHCVFCFGEFMDKDDPAYLNTDEHPVMEEGYTTQNGGTWICEQCFRDFQERFDWKLERDPT